MSQAPTTVTASSTQTPPAATTTLSRTTTAPRGIAESASTISSAAESPSCLSQIGSMISSIVSSIFSWISSIWNYVTSGCTESYAAAETSQTLPAQPPADVLMAKARNFFENRVYRNVQWTDQAKVAFLMILNGRIVGASIATLRENSEAGAPNPFNALCNQEMIRLEQILRQQTLDADSHVQLRMRVLNPARTFTNPSGDSRTLQEGGTYKVDFSASSDLRHFTNWCRMNGPATVAHDIFEDIMNGAAAVAHDIFEDIQCDGPEQEALQANITRFLTNPSDTQTGSIYSI